MEIVDLEMENANEKFKPPDGGMAIDPSKVSLTDIDPVSKVPYLHETFVLHTFMPIRYVRRQKPFEDFTFTGMYPEGFRIPTVLTKNDKGDVSKKSDFDDQITCMMVGKEIVGPDNSKAKNIECVTNAASTRPGFVTISPKGPTRSVKSAPATNKNAPAITREKTKAMLMSVVNSRGTSSKSYLRKQNKMQVESEIEEVAEPLTPRTISRNQIYQKKSKDPKKEKRQKLPDNVEYALALKHPEWPEAASEWPTRTRNIGWPGKRIEKKIASLGCHVTPGAHPKSEDAEIEWMYTFFEAERVMNKEAISSVQRQCFTVFCLLCVDCLENKMLSFQQLKSVFYFVCETLDAPLWRTNKAICVNKLLDTLLECIQCGNLPDYFVHKNNTISHLGKADLVKLESTVSALRANPSESLLSMTDSCAFVNIFPFYCNVRELFKPFLADAADFSKEKNIEKSIRAILTIVDELCNSFYLDAGFEAYEENYEEISYYISSLIAHGVSGFEEAIEYFIKPLQGDSEAKKHLQFMPQLLSQKNISLSEKLPPAEIWRPIRMCRMLITKFANGKEGSHLFDHLGCMYHSASHVDQFAEQKKDVLVRADGAFKEALGKSDCGIGSYVDYGRFLCHTKKYNDSIPVLRKVILKEAKNPQSINFYGRMEAIVADDFIKREIEATDGLEVLSSAYSQYLMCECYIRTKKKDELFKCLKQFEDFCKQTKDAHSYSLLGYTLIKIQQFKKACVQFKTVQELQPSDKLVQENINICQKHEADDKSDGDVTLTGKMEKLNFWEQ